MFQRLKEYLPSRFQAEDSPSDEGDESSSELGSEGWYEDCLNDVDVESGFPDGQKETAGELSSATQNSVYPPLSSIASNAVRTSDGKEGYFVDQKEPKEEISSASQNSVYPPLSSIASNVVLTSDGNEGYSMDLNADDFVQTSPLLESRTIPLSQSFVKTGPLLQNSVCPPLSSLAGNTILSSDGKEGYFMDLSATDNFAQTSPLLQSADSKKISNQTKTAAYKNELQTFCQRRKMHLPAYHHVKEGPPHAPKFKAAVEVDGKWFETKGEHSSKVDAEQAAAKEALTILQPGFSNQLERLPTQQRQPMVKLAPLMVNNNDGRNGSFVEDNGRCSQISGDPLRLEELTNVEESHHRSFSGSVIGTPRVTVKNEMPRGQTSAWDGITIDTAVDLTMDEWSVEPSPPPTTASSPESRERSQILETKQSATFREISTSSTDAKKRISSDKGTTPAGVESHVEGIAGKFSGLRINRSIVPEVKKPAWKTQTVRWPTQTEHLIALSKLDFVTHAFPLLTRLNGLPLEEAFSVNDIEGLQNQPADEVYSYLYTLDGRRRPSTQLPLSEAPSVPEKLLYDCHIYPDGELKFRAEGNNQGTTLLQRTLGFDKVLRVFFEGMIPHAHYKGFLKNGIFVGCRFYQYFVYKPSDRLPKKEKTNSDSSEGVKCYFVCMDSKGDKDLNDHEFRKFNTIIEARMLFMHVHNCATVAKYIARLQLCLTKTVTIEISFSDVNIKDLEDLPSKDESNPDAMFTDGTGFISPDLAKLMPTSIFKGATSDDGQRNDLYEDYPTLIQTRVFHNGAAYKGTLLVNQDLPSQTIQFYKSMKKVESDPSLNGSISSFELVSTSPRAKRAKLSQDLIVLLSICGVDESVFLNAVRDAAEDVLLILRDRGRARAEVLQWEWESDLVEITIQMLEAGIPLEEPHLQKNLLILTKNKMKDFAKGRVPLKGTYYLMGTADPSGTLKPNEVAIFLADGGAVYGNVLVHKPPGKHPGEVLPLNAVHSQDLQNIIGVGKNVIFFSTQGDRPVPHQIANGDLDGDVFWICQNKTVVEQFKEWPTRWSPGHVNSREGKSAQQPKELAPEKLEDIIIDEYLKERFNKSSLVGIAFSRWLAHVDLYLHPDTPEDEKEVHMTEFLKWPDYIYEGVDSAKSGKELTLPRKHDLILRYDAPYLKKIPPSDFKGGKTILGKICELGLQEQEKQKSAEYGRENFHLDETFFVKNSVKFTDSWRRSFDKYRGEMRQALDTKNTDPNGPSRVNLSYKKLLYGAPSFKERTKPMETVLAEASAIYQVVYTHVYTTTSEWDKEPSVAFAWNVAGPALCFIYAEKQPGGNSIVCAPGVYKDRRKRGRVSALRGVGLRGAL